MCFGAIGPKAVIIGPKANHPKGASVFNRTLLLKKALARGGCKKQVLGLLARRLLLQAPKLITKKGLLSSTEPFCFNRALVRGGFENMCWGYPPEGCYYRPHC